MTYLLTLAQQLLQMKDLLGVRRVTFQQLQLFVVHLVLQREHLIGRVLQLHLRMPTCHDGAG
jgi:hypothetical protein